MGDPGVGVRLCVRTRSAVWLLSSCAIQHPELFAALPPRPPAPGTLCSLSVLGGPSSSLCPLGLPDGTSSTSPSILSGPSFATLLLSALRFTAELKIAQKLTEVTVLGQSQVRSKCLNPRAPGGCSKGSGVSPGPGPPRVSLRLSPRPERRESPGDRRGGSTSSGGPAPESQCPPRTHCSHQLKNVCFRFPLCCGHSTSAIAVRGHFTNILM